jgi:hypothetical protein
MIIQEINNKSFQEIFDFVASHLLTQNERAMEEGYLCKYRIGNLKCAVGALIADEDYNHGFEGNSLITLKGIREHSIFNDIEEERLMLLNDLQTVHDRNVVVLWPERLYSLAKKFSLSDEVLKKFEVNEEH